MLNRSVKSIIALALLAVYIPLTATLDLHHNHSHEEVCCTGDLPAAVSAGHAIHSHGESHDPCPVLVLTQSHAPVVVLDLEPDVSAAYLPAATPIHILSRFQPEAYQRGPPALLS